MAMWMHDEGMMQGRRSQQEDDYGVFELPPELEAGRLLLMAWEESRPALWLAHWRFAASSKPTTSSRPLPFPNGWSARCTMSTGDWH